MDAAPRADTVQVFRFGIVHLGGGHGHQGDRAISHNHVIDETDATGALHRQGEYSHGEDDSVAQGKALVLHALRRCGLRLAPLLAFVRRDGYPAL